MKNTKKPPVKHSAKSSVTRKNIRHHIKMTIVPHHANQFRPYLTRARGLVGVLIIASLLFCVSHPSGVGSVLGVEANISSDQLLKDTNDQRAQNGGLPALKYNDQLAAAASLKAQDMFKQQYWDHVAPDGKTPWDWFNKVGYNYADAGENLAKNFTTADDVTSAWMASEKHRENILNKNYQDVGFAVADGELKGEKTKIIVALYGEKAIPAVAGVTASRNAAPTAATGSLLAQIGNGVRSMTPSMIGSLTLLLFTIIVALLAHAYRKRLPAPVRKSWRYHHGAYTAGGLMFVMLAFITLYSGGQI